MTHACGDHSDGTLPLAILETASAGLPLFLILGALLIRVTQLKWRHLDTSGVE